MAASVGPDYARYHSSYRPTLTELKQDVSALTRWQPCSSKYGARMMTAIAKAESFEAAVDALHRSYRSQGPNERHWGALANKARRLEEIHILLDCVPERDRDEDFYSKIFRELSRHKESSWPRIEGLYDEVKRRGLARGDISNYYMELSANHGKLQMKQASFEERYHRALNETHIPHEHFLMNMTKDFKASRNLEEIIRVIEDKYQGYQLDEIHLGILMKKASSLKEIDMLLREVKTSRRSEFFYGALLDHLLKYQEPNWEKIEGLYREAQERRLANHFANNAFIQLATAHRRPFSVIQETFETGPKEISSVNIFIQCARKYKEFQAAEKAFREAPLKDKFTFTNFIVVAGEAKETEAVFRAYEEAKRLGVVDELLENSFIHATRDLKEAERVLGNREDLTPIAYQGLIKAADEENNFFAIDKYFKEAVASHKVSSALFYLYIGITSKYKKWDEGQAAYEESKKTFPDDPYIEKAYQKTIFEYALDQNDLDRAFEHVSRDDMYSINRLMQAANLNHRFDLVQKYYRELPKDEVTYTCFIHAMGRSGRQNLTTIAQSYQEALEHYPNCIEITNAYITAMGNMNAESTAYVAFDNARQKGLTTPITYCAMISACRSYPLAQAVYRLGKESGKVDVNVMNCFMQKALDAKDFHTGEAIYKEILEKRIGDRISFVVFLKGAALLGKKDAVEHAWANGPQRDIHFKNSYMGALFSLNQIDQAKACFQSLVREGSADLYTYLTYAKYLPDETTILDRAPSSIREHRYFQKDPNLVMRAFEEAHHKDSIDYAKYINAAGKMERSAYAYKAFCEAKERGCADAYVYNSMMFAAKQTGRMELFDEIFQEAKSLGIANPATYCMMISIDPDYFHEAISLFSKDLTPIYNAYIHHAKWEDLLRAFEYALDHGLANEITYATFIDRAGKRGKFELAKITFRRAKALGQLNLIGYNSYMYAAFLSNNWKVVHDLYKEIPEPNEVTYSTYINAAACMGHFSHAESCYNRAKEQNMVSEDVGNSWIKACGLRKDFPAAELAFKSMRKKDAYSYKAILQAASETNFLGALQHYYEEAVTNNLSDAEVHRTYTEAMEKHGQPSTPFIQSSRDTAILVGIQTAQSLEDATTLLRNAQRQRIDNEAIYAAYTHKALSLGRQDLTEHIYQEMHDHLSSGSNYYYALMDACTKSQNWEGLKFTFNQAKLRHLDSGLLYAVYIKAMGRAGEWEEAQRAFGEAKAKRLAQKDAIYASMIQACAQMQHLEISEMIFREAFAQYPTTLIVEAYLKAAQTIGDWDKVSAIFDDAKRCGLSSPGMYANMIVFAGRQSRFTEAKRIYRESYDTYRSVAACHNAYVHALALQATFTGDGIAKFIACKEFQQAQIPITRVDDTTIDLRGMYKGVALVALKKAIETSCPLHVVVGDGNINQVEREEIKSFIKEHLDQILPNHEYVADPINLDRFTIRSKSSKRMRW